MNQTMTVLDFYDVNVIKLDQFWKIIELETNHVKTIIHKLTDIMTEIKL